MTEDEARPLREIVARVNCKDFDQFRRAEQELMMNRADRAIAAMFRWLEDWPITSTKSVPAGGTVADTKRHNIYLNVLKTARQAAEKDAP